MQVETRSRGVLRLRSKSTRSAQDEESAYKKKGSFYPALKSARIKRALSMDERPFRK